MSKTRVYISGPMTGIAEHNFPAFNKAAYDLFVMGYDPVNPADKGEIDGWTWEDYLRHDIELLVKCDAIFMLPGWESSKGAKLERFIADQLKMKVITLDVA